MKYKTYVILFLFFNIMTMNACNREIELPFIKSKETPAKSELYPGTPNKKASYENLTWEQIGDLSKFAPLIKPELKNRFCLASYKLRLNQDFSELLNIVCTNNQPNEVFSRLDRLSGKNSGKVVTVKHQIDHSNDGFTSGILISAYRVPIVPKLLRHVPIATLISADSYFGYLKITGQLISDQSSTLGGDLQFGKWQLGSKVELKTSKGKVFESSRNTTLDTYQIEGGNTEMGIGVEYLTDANNPDYRYYQQATLSIANIDGTSTMLEIVRISTKNNDSPETIEQMFIDATAIAADQIQEGIRIRHESGYFNQFFY